MHPLAILSSLAIFASALAAPNIEYSPGPTPTPKPSAVSITAAPEPTRPPATDELRRRNLTPALEIRGVLEKRVDTCPQLNYYSCGNGYCCGTGTICYDYGLCYDPNVDYAAQVSSILASYSNEFTLDGYYSSVYESYMSELSSMYASTTGNYNYATGTLSSTYQTDSASTDSSSGYSYSSSSSKKKKGGKVGMIVGIVVGVVVVIIIALAVWWFIRRRNQKAAATTTAVQQPLMSQAPPPPPMQPPTPAPMSPPPPPQSPYSPSPYDQYAAAAAAGKHNSAYGYQNYPTPPPPGTVEMSSDQKMNPQPNQQPYGQNPYSNGAQYQPPPPPPPPAVGVAEASGDSVYRQPQQQLRPESQYAPQYTPGTSTISPQSTGVASELSGQHFISPQTTGATGQTSGAIPPPPPPPPPQSGPVYEMDSSNYRQY